MGFGFENGVSFGRQEATPLSMGLTGIDMHKQYYDKK